VNTFSPQDRYEGKKGQVEPPKKEVEQLMSLAAARTRHGDCLRTPLILMAHFISAL